MLNSVRQSRARRKLHHEPLGQLQRNRRKQHRQCLTYQSGTTPFWYYPIGLLILTLSIIAVRLTAKFDVNKWLQSRAERREKQVEQLCTHTDIEWFPDGRIHVTSRMNSPPMTIEWICGGCGFHIGDQDFPQKAMQHWARYPREWLKRESKRQRIAEKLGWV